MGKVMTISQRQETATKLLGENQLNEVKKNNFFASRTTKAVNLTGPLQLPLHCPPFYPLCFITWMYPWRPEERCSFFIFSFSKRELFFFIPSELAHPAVPVAHVLIQQLPRPLATKYALMRHMNIWRKPWSNTRREEAFSPRRKCGKTRLGLGLTYILLSCDYTTQRGEFGADKKKKSYFFKIVPEVLDFCLM